MQDGTILSWKSASKTSFSEDSTSLKGHSGSVLSLIIGAKKLFSGSADHTIRVWDCDSLECTHVLNGHTSDVTAVLCWDQYLLSGSLDKTIKVWGASESGNIEEVYIHNVNDVSVNLTSICFIFYFTVPIFDKQFYDLMFFFLDRLRVLLHFVGCMMQKKSRSCYVPAKITVFTYMICLRKSFC